MNILDTFKNYMSIQRIRLVTFHSYNTLNFSKATVKLGKKYLTYLPQGLLKSNKIYNK